MPERALPEVRPGAPRDVTITTGPQKLRVRAPWELIHREHVSKQPGE